LDLVTNAAEEGREFAGDTIVVVGEQASGGYGLGQVGSVDVDRFELLVFLAARRTPVGSAFAL
jgi:hypothetical protein